MSFFRSRVRDSQSRQCVAVLARSRVGQRAVVLSERGEKLGFRLRDRRRGAHRQNVIQSPNLSTVAYLNQQTPLANEDPFRDAFFHFFDDARVQ